MSKDTSRRSRRKDFEKFENFKKLGNFEKFENREKIEKIRKRLEKIASEDETEEKDGPPLQGQVSTQADFSVDILPGSSRF